MEPRLQRIEREAAMTSHRRRILALGLEFALACGVLVVAGAGPVVGEDETVRALTSAAAGRASDCRRLEAFDELRKLDTKDSRTALEALVDSKSQLVALRALATIGRGDQAGGRAKLKAVFEDTKRSDVERTVAFLAYGRLAAKDGTTWDSLASYAKEHCEKGSELEESLLETKAALFPAKGGR